jgi:hypothetical protein
MSRLDLVSEIAFLHPSGLTGVAESCGMPFSRLRRFVGATTRRPSSVVVDLLVQQFGDRQATDGNRITRQWLVERWLDQRAVVTGER